MPYPALSVLLKPASGLCQLHCRYCFYRDLMHTAAAPPGSLMSEQTLETLLQTLRRALTPSGRVTLCFQGGEPMLAGIPFFELVVERCRANNLPADFTIQTNGLAIDENWCRFFSENRFLVGISIDGEACVHDCNRILPDGSGTHAAVLRAVRLLRTHRVPFQVLTVVSAQCASHPRQLYRFYRKHAFSDVQLIACLPPLDGSAPSLSPQRDAYARFLTEFYRLWRSDFQNGLPPFSVREFTELALTLRGLPVSGCSHGKCTPQLVVEADGSVYPCDFYVLPDYRMGSVADPPETLLQSQGLRRFVADHPPLAQNCRDCRYLQLCGGGCRRFRDLWKPELPDCPWQNFLDQALK